MADRGPEAGDGAFPWGLVFGAAAIAASLGARLLLDVLGYDAACPFRALTGSPCPTCFGLRALAALGRGDFPGALSANPLFAAAAIALAVWGVLDAGRLALRRPPPARPPRAAFSVLRWAIPIAIAANWIFLACRD